MKENKAKCFQFFEKWIKEVPVIGFNSAKYDCNIMKVYLCDALQKYDLCMIIIKKNKIFKL